MDLELKQLFDVDEIAFYKTANGERRFRSVCYDGDTTRKDKADEQANLSPVAYSMVYSYVNELLEKIRFDGGAKNKNIRCEWIELDGTRQLILDNGIIAKGCKWEFPEWNNKKRKYEKYDNKYDIIKEKFHLSNVRDIIWLKFTTQGHLGVVARGLDINYRYDLSSGKLVKQVGETWDESFVMIFPLSPDILQNYSSGDIELAIGNYLSKVKKVPIIDYYSHNN